MKKYIIISMMAITGFFSCNQGKKSTSGAIDIKTLDSKKNAQSLKSSNKNVDTKYEYTDSIDASVIIQNSFPKSGIKYKDPQGKNYVYAVFWTRIINETVNPLELKIDFPLDSFEFPASSGNYMKLLLPPDTITIEKEPLFDYGLSVKSFLDKGIQKSSSLKRTINSKESIGFYVVTLSNRGVNGKLRTGFSLKKGTLFYRINGKEIPCGKINLEDLRLKK